MMSQRIRRARLTGWAVGAVLAAVGTGCQSAQTNGTPSPLFGGTASGNGYGPDGGGGGGGPSLFGGGPLLGGGGGPALFGGGRGRGGGGGTSLFGGGVGDGGTSPTGPAAHFPGPRKVAINPAPKAPAVDPASIPKELNKVTLPPYYVEAPDILLIDAQRLIPLPPYRVEPLDQLYIFVPGADPQLVTLNSLYQVEPDGTINLGMNYGGQVRVADLTIPEIEKLLRQKLSGGGFLKAETAQTVTVSLAQSRGVQQVRGQHLIRPDGTVALGAYGSVYVAGLTIPQVKAAIEAHLGRYLYKPEVSVDVYAYNSKFYYVITDFAGNGEQVVRLPASGNETVLDAISMIGGLSSVSSKTVWVARPAPTGCGDQILPVDWRGITRRGLTATNYQVLPGDRVYVMGQPLTKLDNDLARALSPVQRVLGTTLLGYTTVRTISSGGQYGLFGSGGSGTTVNVAGSGTTTTR